MSDTKRNISQPSPAPSRTIHKLPLTATFCAMILSGTVAYGTCINAQGTPLPDGKENNTVQNTVNRPATSPENKCTDLSPEAKAAVIKPVAQAMCEWAEAMPIWGADSESFLAADAMKKAVSEIDAENEPLEESLCKLQRAQVEGAYGLYSARSEESGAALHICEVSDSLYTDLQECKFSKQEKVWEYGAFSCYWSQLFGVIRNELSERSGEGTIFNMGAFGCSFYDLKLLQKMAGNALSEKYISEAYFVFEVTWFFQSYCPLLLCSALSQEDHDAMSKKIIEYATYLDSCANNIRKENYESTPAGKESVFSNDSLENFLRKAAEMKAYMLNTLASNVQAANK